MRLIPILFLFLFFQKNIFAQTIANTLSQAFTVLDKDTCLQKANISFCLLNAKNADIIFEKNKNTLLAPASTLKTFTTATALKILGEDFQYKTRITFKGNIKNKIATGTLVIYGSGDPSFGSDRYPDTKPDMIFKQILFGLKKMGIEKLIGNIEVVKNIFSDESINTFWLDEDVGNYYGAGLYALNWKENKFEINLSPTKNSFIVSSNNAGYDNIKDFCIELTHKDGASTEEAFAYIEKLKPCMYNIKGVLSDKVPIQNMQLARLTPEKDFAKDLSIFLKREIHYEVNNTSNNETEIEIATILSPPLRKLVYWCNQKSLNLYAESFCKTIAVKLFKQGTWRMGISAMLRFAQSLKINTENVDLKDGCGLAEENKITTNLLASMLQRNMNEKYFQSFYESLPSINGIIMKSGYIGGTRSYAGYIKLKDSTDACFAFIIHGYTCSPKEVKLKMFQVLDKLK